MKKIISLIVLAVLTLSLFSCSGGISGDEAKDYVNDFFDAVEDAAEDDDYVIAKSFLHPDCPADIEDFVKAVSLDQEVDFSDIEIEKYTGFSSSYYDSRVGGSSYSLSMKISVSDKTANAEIQIINNDKGYGIYNIDIKF